jgi:4-carboxymuconolactone decarboxylase
MAEEPSAIQKMFGDFAPRLAELTDDLVLGDIWERPGLSKRDRSLITVAALTALYRTNELPAHMLRARANGVTKDEMVELITHLAFYAGWPTAMTAIRIAQDVFARTE